MKNVRKKINPKDNESNQVNGQKGNPKPDKYFVKAKENEKRQEEQVKKPDPKLIQKPIAPEKNQLQQPKEKPLVTKAPKQAQVAKPAPKPIEVKKDRPVAKKKK